MQQGIDDLKHVAALERFQTAGFQGRSGQGDLPFGGQQRVILAFVAEHGRIRFVEIDLDPRRQDTFERRIGIG